MEKIYDVIIIGAGPAGLSAGLYAGRGRLGTLIIEKAGKLFRPLRSKTIRGHWRLNPDPLL